MVFAAKSMVVTLCLFAARGSALLRNQKLRKFQPDLVERKGENGYDKATQMNPAARRPRRYHNMKLGEKLQRLRRQSGLSQEQLAARLAVSRQAVSKWELNETMPDTENVIQLSRLFGVSCDYLLQEEVTEPNASPPPQDAPRPAPSETRPTEPGLVHRTRVLSMVVIAIGLLIALGGWLQWQATGPVLIGLAVQISGVALFELEVPRMAGNHTIIRLIFYKAAVWFLMPVPMYGLCWLIFVHAVRPYPSVLELATYISCYSAFSGTLTAALTVKQLWLQRKIKQE